MKLIKLNWSCDMKNVETVSAILNIIREYSEANPELRFHQILWKLHIIEGIEYGVLNYYDELSAETLARLQKVGK